MAGTGRQTDEERRKEEEAKKMADRRVRSDLQTGPGYHKDERIDEVPPEGRGTERIEKTGEPRTQTEETTWIGMGRFEQKSEGVGGYADTGRSKEEALQGETGRLGAAERAEREVRAGRGGKFGESVREGWESKETERRPTERPDMRAEERRTGTSPQESLKPEYTERGEPMHGAGEELTSQAEKGRSGKQLRREDMPSGDLGPEKTGYRGELQSDADHRGRYGITGRSGELLRTEEQKMERPREYEKAGMAGEQMREREELRRQEMGTSEERTGPKSRKEDERYAEKKRWMEQEGGVGEESERGQSRGAGWETAEIRSGRTEYQTRVPGQLSPGEVAERSTREIEGRTGAFNADLIEKDIINAGVPPRDAQEIVEQVERSASPDTTTQDAYNEVRTLLRERNPEWERNWVARMPSLRESWMSKQGDVKRPEDL
jgi:hypothetical protein